MNEELAKSIVTDEHLEKTPKEDQYGRYELNHDYAANGQIMVTITLSEYRALVRTNADLKVNEANSKMYDLRKERDEFQKQVTELQKQLNDLKAVIATAVPAVSLLSQKENE